MSKLCFSNGYIWTGYSIDVSKPCPRGHMDAIFVENSILNNKHRNSR